MVQLKSLIKMIVALLLLFAVNSNKANAQFLQNNSVSIFADLKAFKVGDAVMVMIMEDTEAGNGAGVDEERGTDLSAGAGLDVAGNVQGNLSTGNKFRSKANNNRNERIRSKISCRVISVDSNGNLSLEGKRVTKVNGETQTVTIKGFVRQVDIQPNNTIYSYNIMDLTLIIEGNGNLTETSEPGLITKFLRILF